MPLQSCRFALEDALSLIVLFLPVTCSVGLSLLAAAIGPIVFFLCCGGNRRPIATMFWIQAVLAALMDLATMALLLAVASALIARTCSFIDGWNDDAQLGIVAWRIGWTLTLSFGCLHIIQGSSWTYEELLPSIGRNDALGKDMVRRSVSVLVMDVGVSVLGVAIENWIVPFRGSTILLFQIGEQQLRLAFACILMVLVCASLFIHKYCFHVVGDLSNAQPLEGALWECWRLLHTGTLFSVSLGVNAYLLLKVLPWYFHGRSSRRSWSAYVYEALVHDVNTAEFHVGPISDSQELFDALVIGQSEPAYPEGDPLGHVVLEAGGRLCLNSSGAAGQTFTSK